ncbi:hypothetical protein ACFWP7_23990 [Streptomyces sp. NPDC058470]|uniref:hypothetical protein n=1 Tax=Streptomyces sp. NPDC058470 TaxID=3346515 RepID=UPI00365A2B41
MVDTMRHRGRGRGRIDETFAPSAPGRHLRRSGRCRVGELQGIARELDTLAAIRPAVGAVLV